MGNAVYHILIAIFSVTAMLKAFNVYSFVFFEVQFFKLKLLLNDVNNLEFLWFYFVIWMNKLYLVFEINEKLLIYPNLLSGITLIHINIQVLNMNFRNELLLNLITLKRYKLFTLLHLRIIYQMHVLVFADHHEQNSLLSHFFIREVVQK